MKNKMIMVILSICIVITSAACGSSLSGAKPSASDLTTGRSQEGDRAEDTEDVIEKTENEEVIGDAEAANAKEQKEADRTAQTGTSAGRTGLVFGSADAAGYKEFKYLTEEHISTARTNSKKDAAFSVYIPKGDSIHVSGTTARSGQAGVYVKIDLEPNLQYRASDYSVRENLEYYVDGEMEYYDNYYDADVSMVEETDEDFAVCEVSYMKYDSYEETFAPYYAVYSLYDLGDGVTALVTVIVDAENTEEEAKDLLSELSSFYQFDVHWDESFAKIMSAKFENTGEAVDGIFYIGNLSFKLPEGWKKDEDMSEYGEIVFAPGGDSEEAGGYMAMDVMDMPGMVDFFMENLDDMEDLFLQDLVEAVGEIAVEDYGTTFLGHTIILTAVAYEDEDSGICLAYLAEDDKNSYLIMWLSVLDEDADENARLSDEIQEGMDMFWETGRVEN